MSIGDIIILLGVAVWAVIAVKRGWKNRKRGCGGDCGSCSGGCNKENKPGRKMLCRFSSRRACC